MAPSEQSQGGSGPSRISRRTLAKGVAWTTPVVMLGVPVPAFAVSGCCVNATWTSAAYSGANGTWALGFSFTNCGAQQVRLTSYQVFIKCNGTGAYQSAIKETGNLTGGFNAGATTTYNTGKTKWPGPTSCFNSDATRRCYYEPATNEKQRITQVGSVTTFRLTFQGQTTADIAGGATAAQVQAALELLSNIAPGDIVVTGGPLGVDPITVEFTGAYALTDVTQMTVSNKVGTGTVVVTTRVQGGPCDDVECHPVDSYPGWAGHRPCEVLLRDKTKVTLTFTNTNGATCSITRDVFFSTSQQCGTTAGCSGLF